MNSLPTSERRYWRGLLAGLAGVTVAGLAAAAPPPVFISEFMADNASVVTDRYGEASDWIEIQNASASAVSLAGWHLTDKRETPTQWTFPGVSVPAGASLLVFASGKDDAVAGQELHTNFKLSADGEYLALVRPDGTLASEFDPYPALAKNVSYGWPRQVAQQCFVPEGAVCRYRVPTNAVPGTNWVERGFDDTGWDAGPTAVGYDRDTTYLSLIGCNVSNAMYTKRTAVYLRLPFVVETAVLSLTLQMKYDDGFVAWVNGRPVASALAPATPAWNSAATGSHADGEALVFQSWTVNTALSNLVAGTNILAIQGLNASSGSSDLLFMPRLEGSVTLTNEPTGYGCFTNATPGAPNGGAVAAPAAPAVRFSVESQAFTTPFAVTLTCPDAPGAEIRYTTNNAVPTTNDTLYAATLTVDRTLQVRARAFAPDRSPGPIRSACYVRLDAAVAAFSSPLPVVMIDSLGGSAISNNVVQAGCLSVFAPGTNGRTRLDQPAELVTRMGVMIHGQTSAGFPQKSYAVEAWQSEVDDDRDIAPLGFPADSDWVLHAPSSYDRTLMHNALMYRLSNEAGRYAPRTRFVEVFVIEGGNSTVTTSRYNGVYALVEKIKRSPDRVAVDKLLPEHATEPVISGGYIVKHDKGSPGDVSFSAGGTSLIYDVPDGTQLTATQKTWLTAHLNTFWRALTNRTAVGRAYTNSIDVGSFIDHNLLNMIAKNVDGLRISTYSFKPRQQPFAMGPIWDFDRALESTDGRDDNPFTWNGTSDATVYLDYNSGYPWWGTLYQDPDYAQAYVDRWYALRRTVFNSAHLTNVIGAMSAELTEAAARHFVRWKASFPPRYGGWTGEVSNMRTWLTNRAAWVDSQFVAPPVLTPPRGDLDGGAAVGFSLPPPVTGTIYYTADGTDPRAPGGLAAAQGAVAATGCVPAATCTIRARILSGTNWSGLAEAPYYVGERGASAANVRVTELMFHPADPPQGSLWTDQETEFVEVMNVSTGRVQLEGSRFERGLTFTFPRLTLAPGECVVVAASLAAFAGTHDTNGVRLAGEYTGALDNAGETIEWLSAAGETIQSFSYRDAWSAACDGAGYSLTINDPRAPAAAWTNAAAWHASAPRGGTPGWPESDLPAGAVVINEALTHTDADVDWVELHNTTAADVNLGGWLLSDDAADLAKFEFPAGTVIAARGFLTVDATAFDNPLHSGCRRPFGLSELGESIHLSSGSGGAPTGYRESAAFGAAEREVTFGRVTGCDGTIDFVPLQAATRGASNAPPRVGPVVLSELMVHPDDDGFEYAELHNITPSAVPLFDPLRPANGWQLTGAAYTFTGAVTLAAGAYAVVAGAAPEVFRARHAVPTNVAVFGPFTGQLANEGETVALLQPLEPETNGFIPYGLIERVHYTAAPPWPAAAEEGDEEEGAALERIDDTAYGNDPCNWRRSNRAGSPGAEPQIDADDDGLPDNWQHCHFTGPAAAQGHAEDDPDNDGWDNGREYLLGTDPLVRDEGLTLRLEPDSGGRLRLGLTTTPACGIGYAGLKRRCAFEASPAMGTAAAWQPAPGGGPFDVTTTTVQVSSPTTNGPVFYRARLWLE